MQDDDPENALAFLDRNLALFPESVRTYGAMADAHLAQGDRDAAIESLEQALALRPNDFWLRRRLQELREGQ